MAASGTRINNYFMLPNLVLLINKVIFQLHFKTVVRYFHTDFAYIIENLLKAQDNV